MKKVIFFALAFALILSGTAIAHAQTSTQAEALKDPGILPGSPLYFVKNISESIGSAFTFGATNKAKRNVKMAQKRLSEAKALAERGNADRASSTIERYRSQLERAQNRANKASDENEEEIASLVASSTLKNQSALADVYERVPEQAKGAIEHAIEVSRKGHNSAMNGLSDEQRQRVEEKLQGVQERVNNKLDELRERGVPIPEHAGPSFGENATGTQPGPGNLPSEAGQGTDQAPDTPTSTETPTQDSPAPAPDQPIDQDNQQPDQSSEDTTEQSPENTGNNQPF